MRCLALARQLSVSGAGVCFFCRELPGHLCDLVEEQGFECRRLPANPISAENPPWSIDALQDAELVLAQCQEDWDWCVVDHYGLAFDWERAVRSRSRRVMCIDDKASRRHDCDLLLDQNLDWNYQSLYAALVPEHARLLLGPRFALLRHEFADRRSTVALRQKISRLLLAFGGGDAANETGRVLSMLAEWPHRTFDISVVIGASHPARAQIQALAEKHALECAIQVADMDKRIAEADIAIGAGGVNAWERCCLGLPSLIITLAENQWGIASALEQAGAAYYLGRAGQVDAEQVFDVLRECQRPGVLAAMSEMAMSLVDGQGAGRVARILLDWG